MRKLKLLLILCFLIVITCVTGCTLTEEEKIQKKQNEKQATEYMSTFLKQEFGKAKIKEVSGVKEWDNFSVYLTDYVSVTAEIDGKEYNFAYNCKTNNVLTSMYYAKIIKQFESQFWKLTNIEKGAENNFEIDANISRALNYKLIPYEHKSLTDILDYNKTVSAGYEFSAEIIYNNRNDIDYLGFDMDKLFDKFPNTDVVVYNTSKLYGTSSSGLYEKMNVADYVYYSLIDNEDEKEPEIYIDYEHRKIQKFKDVYVAYNDNYCRVALEQTKDIPSQPATNYYPDTDFVSLKRGFDVLVTKIQSEKIEFQEDISSIGDSKYYIKTASVSNRAVKVCERNIYEINFRFSEDYENIYANFAEERSIKLMNDSLYSREFRVFLIETDFIDNQYHEKIGFYKEKKIKY